MDSSVVSIVVTILFALSSVSFLLLVIGLFKPSFVVRRQSLQTRKGVFLIWGLLGIFFTGGWILVVGIAEPTSDLASDETFIYYTGAQGANIRGCPDTSCKVVDTLSPNTILTFYSDPFDTNPDWAKYVFSDDSVGYVSKIALSSEPSTESPPQRNGIALGTGDFEPLVVGYSYGFSFCVPESARSGATCGGLAGATQSPVGGSPPYSLVKGSGFFPPGMSLELNGWFSGSPTIEGTYNFQICAKDLQMNQGCQNYVMVVIKEDTSPVSTPNNYTTDNSSDLPLPPAKEEVSMPVISSFECTRLAPYPGSALLGEGGYYFTVRATGHAGGPVGTSFGFGSNEDLRLSSCGSWDGGDRTFSPTGKLTCYRSSESMSEEITWTIVAKNHTDGYTDIIGIWASRLPKEINLNVNSVLYFKGGIPKEAKATTVCQ